MVEGLDYQQIKRFIELKHIANEEQVFFMIKSLVNRIPMDRLHNLLDIVNEEYVDRGLDL